MGHSRVVTKLSQLWVEPKTWTNGSWVYPVGPGVQMGLAGPVGEAGTFWVL